MTPAPTYSARPSRNAKTSARQKLKADVEILKSKAVTITVRKDKLTEATVTATKPRVTRSQSRRKKQEHEEKASRSVKKDTVKNDGKNKTTSATTLKHEKAKRGKSVGVRAAVSTTTPKAPSNGSSEVLDLLQSGTLIVKPTNSKKDKNTATTTSKNEANSTR